MTNLEKLGDELRRELGDPPDSFTERQRQRLRGVDLTPKKQRNPALLVAAIAASGLLALGVYVWPSASSSLANKSDGRPSQPAKPASAAEVWVEAGAQAATRRLRDGSEMVLEPGARGRLDQHADLGVRFDLHAGTAAFDIKKQKVGEFAVVAGQYRVTVVGTRFTTAYAPPRQLSVAVGEGAVLVDIPGHTPVRVAAGEILKIEGREFALSEQRKDAGEAALALGRSENGALRSTAETSDVQVSGAEKKAPPSASWEQLYREGKYQKACEDARARSLSVLSAKLDAPGLIELHSALRLCSAPGDAMSTLETLRRRFPGSSHAHDALFLMGRIHATQGHSAAALTHFEQYLARASQGRFAAEALGRLIELYEAAGNRQKARKYAQQYLRLAPDGPYRRLAASVTGTAER
jgi:TolA-binding protein